MLHPCTIQPGRYIISKAPTLNHSGTWIDVTWNLENRNTTWIQRWHGRFICQNLKWNPYNPWTVTSTKYLFLIPMGFHFHVKYPNPVFSFESSDRWNLQINSMKCCILTIYHPGMFACCCARVSGFRWSLELHPENKMSMLYINVPVDDKGSYHQRV